MKDIPYRQVGMIALTFWRGGGSAEERTPIHLPQQALSQSGVALFHHTGTQQAWRGQPGPPTRSSLPGGNHRLNKRGSGRTFPTSYASHASWPIDPSPCSISMARRILRRWNSPVPLREVASHGSRTVTMAGP